MNRSFSRRETILLLILAILLLAVVYYMAVDMPVRDTIMEAEARVQAAEDQLTVENVRLEKMNKMQEALESLEGEETAVVPDYDNSQGVIVLLGRVLAAADAYDLNFRQVEFRDRIAVRTVDMTYTCGSYAAAEQIVRDLYQGGYRCEISPIRFQTSGAGTAEGLMDGAVSASISVTFFEYVADLTAVETEEGK